MLIIKLSEVMLSLLLELRLAYVMLQLDGMMTELEDVPVLVPVQEMTTLMNVGTLIALVQIQDALRTLLGLLNSTNTANVPLLDISLLMEAMLENVNVFRQQLTGGS